MKYDDLAEVIDLAAARAEAEAANKLAASLMRSGEGAVYPTITNALVIMAHDPALAGLVAYNSFTHKSLIMRAAPVAVEGGRPFPGPYPRPWDDADVVLVTSYIQRVYCPRMSPDVVHSAMTAEAKLHEFHPVREYFAGLQWDGIVRLDTWLHVAGGCPDDEYHAAVGAKMLIAAVRRILHPGTKFDTMPVFEGLQGLGKSTLLRRMMADEDWFSDSMPANLEGKDAAMALAGRLIIEFAELQHVVRSEVETIKAFLSRAVDRYRPPYGRNVIDIPRQCIVIGTTNETDYLRDTTGNRRFWPVRFVKVDMAWIDANRDQLWAEAVSREREGEPIYLEGEILDAATSNQRERLEEDVWAAEIGRYVVSQSRVTVAEVLTECLNVPRERQTRREQMRVANVLRALGWVVKVERGYMGVQQPLRVYYPPEWS